MHGGLSCDYSGGETKDRVVVAVDAKKRIETNDLSKETEDQNEELRTSIK